MIENNNLLEQNNLPETSMGKEMITSRQIQEVQAAVLMAKRFPRDEKYASKKILEACSSKSLAEEAEYTYPRGGTKVNGPSIRLAEVIARHWGNLDYGIVELERKQGYSEMMSYCWDLETNTRDSRYFTVEHVRETKKSTKKLTDSRDIYEVTANLGARRLRACILALIPTEIQQEAIKVCRSTLEASYNEPLPKRLEKMLKAYEEIFKVTREMIEKNVGYKIESFNEKDYLKLRGIYKAINDGMAKPEDYFYDLKPEIKVQGETDLEKELKEMEGNKKVDKPSKKEEQEESK